MIKLLLPFLLMANIYSKNFSVHYIDCPPYHFVANSQGVIGMYINNQLNKCDDIGSMRADQIWINCEFISEDIYITYGIRMDINFEWVSIRQTKYKCEFR